MSESSAQLPALPELAMPSVPRVGSVAPTVDPSPETGPSGCGCSSCGCGSTQGTPRSVAVGGTAGSPVYAVGRLRARFPSVAVEREVQALAGSDPQALLAPADVAELLSSREHLHLARHMCWVLEGPLNAEACVVTPRDREDLDTFVVALSDDEDVVHAVVGSPATAETPFACPVRTGLPAVWADQFLSFKVDEFIDAMPTPPDLGEGHAVEEWRQNARSLFNWLTQRSGNLGTSDQHRAMNYLALRYPALYHLTYQQQTAGSLLIGVDARRSFTADRRAVTVRLTFRNPHTQVVERYQCDADIHDVLPFLAQPLARTYE